MQLIIKMFSLRVDVNHYNTLRLSWMVKVKNYSKFCTAFECKIDSDRLGNRRHIQSGLSWFRTFVHVLL